MPRNGSHHDAPEDCIQALRDQANAFEQQLQEIRNTLLTAGAPEFDERLDLNDLPSRLFQFAQDAILRRQDNALVLKEKAGLQTENNELRQELAQLQADQAKASQAHD